MTINAAGATIAAPIGYFYVYEEDSLLGRRLVEAVGRHKKNAGGSNAKD